jgi:heme exporter protein CcmD
MDHAAFIWSSYGAVAIVLALLVIGLWLDGRRHARDLALLERQGLGRGGDQPAHPTGAE